MTDYSDPKRSVELLKQLRAYGYSDQEFATLHHFGKDNRETIQSHMDYCANVRRFRPGSNNAFLQSKLEQELQRLKTN
ncbi:MAG: hypothetical protein ACR2QB_11490 [Gammaproteobacteria bacterium]